MNRQTARAAGAGATLLAAVGGLAAITAMATGPAAARSGAARAVPSSAAGPGSVLWVRRYDGPGHGVDVASAIAVSPGGRTVFVTGTSPSKATGIDYATVAYNAMTGRRLWVSRYHGPGHGVGTASAIAVSPDGRTVFVTGTSPGRGTGSDCATVAYSAATGKQLWVSRYNSPGNSDDTANAMAVSPDGRKVFITGRSYLPQQSTADYATVAYNAATGRQLWARLYHAPIDGGDTAVGVAVSPAGQRIFVTGSLYYSSWNASPPAGNYYGTVAYNASTGTQLWARFYPQSAPIPSYDMPFALAVSRHGNKVIVAGRPDTVAYTFSGRQLWAKWYAGDPRAVVINPPGTKAYVTGGNSRYTTIAYNTATGARLWISRYTGPPGSAGLTCASAAGISPDGKTVYVAGTSGRYGYAVIAYNAATGARIWIGRYNAGRHLPALAVSPRGDLVFLAGTTHGDYTTIAYKNRTQSLTGRRPHPGR